MKERGSVAVLIILLLVVFMGWAVYSGKINVSQGSKKQEKQQTTTVASPQDKWQTFKGAGGKFSIDYPPAWKVTKMPGTEDFTSMRLEGKEGYVDLMWGTGFGGWCPSEGNEKLQVKNEELPVCHEFMEDGTEHWRDISKVLDKETGFSGRGVAYTPVSKNRETILKILSTLDFVSK